MNDIAHEIYDRRVDDSFIDLFRPAGVLHILARLGKEAAFPLDLQFRKDPKNPNRQWATLYAGLTGVLYVYRTKRGIRLDAHDTWSGKKTKKARYGFRQEWLSEMTLAETAEQVGAIEHDLEPVIPAAVKSHG